MFYNTYKRSTQDRELQKEIVASRKWIILDFKTEVNDEASSPDFESVLRKKLYEWNFLLTKVI